MSKKIRSLPPKLGTLGGEMRSLREQHEIPLSAMSRHLVATLHRSINPGYLSLMERNRAFISKDIVACYEVFLQVPEGTLLSYFDLQPIARRKKSGEVLAYRPLMLRFTVLEAKLDEVLELLRSMPST